MPTYLGIFTNKTGSYNVEVINDFDEFYMQIGAFKFSGSDLDSFELDNTNEFTEQELIDFGVVIHRQNYNELKNYQLSLKIPQILIDMSSKKEIEVTMDVQLELKDNFEQATVSFQIDDEHYEGKHDFMELIFDEIQRQFNGKYRFKNCYGCLYADYSVYGQGLMSSVLCFKNQKEAYLQVQNKNEYMMNLELHDSQQQEIYYCDEYEIRDKSVGYRGTVL